MQQWKSLYQAYDVRFAIQMKFSNVLVTETLRTSLADLGQKFGHVRQHQIAASEGGHVVAFR